MSGTEQTPRKTAGSLTNLSVTDIAPLHQAEIVGLHFDDTQHEQELERRLLELGFVEGARISVLHEGLFGKDPIVLQVDDMRIALRRAQASRIKVRTLE